MSDFLGIQEALKKILDGEGDALQKVAEISGLLIQQVIATRTEAIDLINTRMTALETLVKSQIQRLDGASVTLRLGK